MRNETQTVLAQSGEGWEIGNSCVNKQMQRNNRDPPELIAHGAEGNKEEAAVISTCG